MVYSQNRKEIGITISVKAYRKSRGMKGCGRGGRTGKKADITQKGKATVTILGDSFRDLSRKIREQFNIPSWIAINSSGVTNI